MNRSCGMTMGQRRRHKSVVRKSLVISEKQTAKKHEAAQRYLFHMSGIQWGQHKKKQRTSSLKQREAERERRNRYVEAPDQPHVRCGDKNKLEEAKMLVEEAKTLVNLKRQKLIQEGRDANARFEDLLTLANSAELLETQGVCDVDKSLDATHRTGNAHTEKDALHDVDKSLDAPCGIGNVQAEKDTLGVKERMCLTHFRHQDRLENPLPIQEIKKHLLAIQLAELLKEGPSVAREKRLLRTSKRRKQRSENPLLLQKNHIKEKHDCADTEKFEVGFIDLISEKRKPPLWKHVTIIDKIPGGGNVRFKCNFCGIYIVGSYPRVKGHLLGAVASGTKRCQKVTQEDHAEMRKVQDAWELKATTRARAKLVPLPTASNKSQCCSSSTSTTSSMRLGGSTMGGSSQSQLKRKKSQGLCVGTETGSKGLLGIRKQASLVEAQASLAEAEARDSVIRDYTNRIKKHLLAIQLAQLLKEGPSVAREKRLLRTSKLRKQRFENPLPTQKNHFKEGHDCADPRKFEEDRTAEVNGLLLENNLKSQQERGDAPLNCETETPRIHLSEAPEGCDSVALNGVKQKRPSVSQMPQSLDCHIIARHGQMLKSVDQGTRPSQRTDGSDKHESTDGKFFEDTRTDKSVEAQQVQGAGGLQDTQELRVIAERKCNRIADIRKQASMPDPMKVTNENSVPCVEPDTELIDITENTSAKSDGPLKENNRSTQHRFGHVTLTSDELPVLPDANTGKSKEADQASVVEPTELTPIRKEKRKCPEDVNFAIHRGRPKLPENFQLPETLKEGVWIARQNRMIRILERRKQRSGGTPCPQTMARYKRMLRTLERRKQRDGGAPLHWSQTYQANQWWMWHFTNSQKYEQAHIAKHHESTIYTHYPAQDEQSRVTAREKQLREDSLMAAAQEKQLRTPDIATCTEKDLVGVELNQNVSVPNAHEEQPVASAQPMEPTDCISNMAIGGEKEIVSEVCQDQDVDLQQQFTNEETTFVERKSQLSRLKQKARQKSAKIEKKTGAELPRQKDKENKPRRSSRLLELQQHI